MRLKVQFGFIDAKEVSWYDHIDNFPRIIKFLGRNYEWFMYDKDPSGKVDMILTFSEIPNYDPNYDVFCPEWNDLFGNKRLDCECGASYSSFPWDHLRYCPLWSPW